MVQDGATLHITDAHIGDETLSLAGMGDYIYTLLSTGYLSDSNSWAGDITLESDVSIGAFYSTNTLNLLGQISGPGGLTKNGLGTLILSGTNANAYGGATCVEEGTLVLNKFPADGAVPGHLIIGDGTGGAGADVVRLERANQIANAGDVTIASSGPLGSGHLLAGHSGSSFTYDGLVSGTGYLWKVGSGTWTLTGNNTYLGTTYIETGTVLVNGWQPASDVEIGSACILGGIGTVGRITSTGGMLSPGVSPGILTSSNLLFDSSSGNDVVLTATNTAALRPMLTIWHTTTNTVAVAWPLSDIAWLLHATTNLAATPTSWIEMPPPYRTNGGNLQVIEAAPKGSRFYRLHGP